MAELFGRCFDVGQQVRELSLLKAFFPKRCEQRMQIFLGGFDSNGQKGFHLFNEFSSGRSKQGVIHPWIPDQSRADFVGERCDA